MPLRTEQAGCPRRRPETYAAPHSVSAAFSQRSRRLRRELSPSVQTPGPRRHLYRGCGFESHSSHRCLFALILCLSCPVCRWRLYDGLIPCPRDPTDCLQALSVIYSCTNGSRARTVRKAHNLTAIYEPTMRDSQHLAGL